MENGGDGEATENPENGAGHTGRDSHEVRVDKSWRPKEENRKSCENGRREHRHATGGQRAEAAAAPSPRFFTSKGKGKLRDAFVGAGRHKEAGCGSGGNSPGEGPSEGGAGSSNGTAVCVVGGRGIFDGSGESGGGEAGGEGPRDGAAVAKEGERGEEKEKREKEKGKGKKKKKKMLKCVICLTEDDEQYLKTPCCSVIAQ